MINLEFKGDKCSTIVKIDGCLKFNKPLSERHHKYLNAFFKTKRIIRDVDVLREIPDPLREAVNLPIGEEGCYFVASANNPMRTKSIIDYKVAPSDQPNSWCAWYPSNDGSMLEISMDNVNGRKDWLQYMIDNFFNPWGYSISGKIKFTKDPAEYTEIILVESNVIEVIMKYIAFS